MSLCVSPQWRFIKRVENFRLVEIFMMYVLVETMQTDTGKILAVCI